METLCENTFRDCDCFLSNPLGNFSSEAPDLPAFRATYFSGLQPLLGMDWGQIACMRYGDSLASQQAADLLAAVAAEDCVVSTWSVGGDSDPPVPPPFTAAPHRANSQPVRFFRNTAQDATVNCPDGLPFTYTVPAGLFGGLSQLIANTEAQSYAQQLAVSRLICLSGITDTGEVGQDYSGTIFATGAFLSPTSNVWELVSGALPDGLTFVEFIFTTGLAGTSIHLTGKPTKAGVYNFTIAVTDPEGDYQQKPYTITITGGCVEPVQKLAAVGPFQVTDFGGFGYKPGIGARFLMEGVHDGFIPFMITFGQDTGAVLENVIIAQGTGSGAVVYDPTTDRFYAYGIGISSGYIPQPLGISGGGPAFGNFLWDALWNPLNELIYVNGNTDLTVFNPMIDPFTFIADLNSGSPQQTFSGNLTLDTATNRLFVAILNFDVSPSLGFVNVYDCNFTPPVLLHQWAIPGGPGGVVINGAVFCAAQNKVYVIGSELDGGMGDQRDFVIVLNATTGAILKNLDAPDNIGGLATYGGLTNALLNPAKNLLFIPGSASVMVLCTLTDTFLPSISLTTTGNQGVYMSDEQMVAFLSLAGDGLTRIINKFGAP